MLRDLGQLLQSSICQQLSSVLMLDQKAVWPGRLVPVIITGTGFASQIKGGPEFMSAALQLVHQLRVIGHIRCL
jgi:hypothetical protein